MGGVAGGCWFALSRGDIQGSSSMVFGVSMGLMLNTFSSVQYWLLQKAPATIQQGTGAATQPQVYGRWRAGTEGCRRG